MSYEIQASLPTQCAMLTLAWSGPAGGKRIEAWVEGDNFFSERIASNVSGTLGTVDWVCDFPAGARIAFEIYKLPTGQPYGTTPFFTVQPGTSDTCLRQNPGQLASASMAALASSLSSASPHLFTGYSTSATASSSSSSSPVSSASATASSASSSDGGSTVSTSALVGGIVGGVAGLVLAAAALWWFRRRRRRRSFHRGGVGAASTASVTTGDELEKEAVTPIVPPAGGYPVNAWLGRVQTSPSAPGLVGTSSVWSAAAGNFSFRNALGWSPTGLATTAVSPSIGSDPTTTATTRSQGPRADLPEVGESGDYSAYNTRGATERCAPIPTHDVTYSTSGETAALPLPSTLYPRSNGPTAQTTTTTPGIEGQSRPRVTSTTTTTTSSPPRPPTRLMTPGGFSLFGAADPPAAGASGYVYDQVEPGLYASRPAGGT